MQKVNTGCWINDFDKILLSCSKNKSIIWIYTWTRWTTCWEPVSIRRVRSLRSNCTRLDSSGLFITLTSNSAMVWFRFGTGPKATHRNRLQHFLPPLGNFDTADWIQRHLVGMSLLTCESKIRVARKMGRRDNTHPQTVVGGYAGTMATIDHLELPNTTFMVAIHWVSKGNHIILSPTPLQPMYTGIRESEELLISSTHMVAWQSDTF